MLSTAAVAQSSAAKTPAAPAPAASPSALAPVAAPSDAALNALLDQLRETAMRAESDVAHLQIERWKTDASTREQALKASDSVRRNLSYAVPELIQKLRGAPGSLSANFRLYRNMNALYDTFSMIVASSGAFSGRDSSNALDADLAQIDAARRQLAERNDQLATNGDAELARARTRPATAAPAKAPSHVVVDDNTTAGRKAKSNKSAQH